MMKTSEILNVLIIDDHALIRDCWKKMLETDPKYQVIAEFGNAEKAIENASLLAPDIILMDINLPGMNGIEATGHLHKLFPAAKILGVSFHVQPVYASKIIKAGASGYISKNVTFKDMMEALSEIVAGKKFISDDIVQLLTENFYAGEDPYSLLTNLTKRESDVVNLLYKGLSAKEIGEILDVSAKTVDVHRHNIFKKLKINKTATLINLINKHGIVFNTAS